MKDELNPSISMGLDAIFSSRHTNKEDSSLFKNILISKLHSSPYQARKIFSENELLELANSIKEHGILQPIIVRLNNYNKYEIIAGERRWRAAKLAHLDSVPCIIKDVSDETVAAFVLIENIQRQDLNPIEEAEGYKRLIDEFKLSHQEIAKRVGKSRSTISNFIRLVNLNVKIKEYLVLKKIEVGHAKVLLGFDDDYQLKLAEQVIIKGLSVRQLEKAVKDCSGKVFKEKKELDIILFEPLKNSLEQKLGKRVDMKLDQNGRGKIIFYINGLNDLKSILERLRDCK